MDRFNRNILIKELGEEGQQKLFDSKVLVIGAGGLGSPVLYYLAAAGIGTLGIMDYDTVDISNLQRQILHQYKDIDTPKTDSAAEKLKAFYPEITIQTYRERFTIENADKRIEKYDFIVECCDNYDAKFLVNDICVKAGKPFSHAAVLTMKGEVMTYIPGRACYRCVYDNPPQPGTMPTSAQVGILGSIAGLAGTIQATETIKYLTGIGSLITNRLLIFNGSDFSFHSLQVKQNAGCICHQQ